MSRSTIIRIFYFGPMIDRFFFFFFFFFYKEHSVKTKPHVIFMIVSLLICVLISSCTGDGNTEPTQTTVPVTSALVPTKPPTSSPTETPVPSPTPIPSPTPVPGEFLNRPAYLQELFSNTDWVWVDHSIGATVGTYQYNSSKCIYVGL